MERFRICELYAELLHCSSLSLLNHPESYGPTYDSEGRLIGGLSALEELARVIANGAAGGNTPPPQVSRALDTDGPSHSRDLHVSVSSVDQMSIVSGSSEGDTEYLSTADDSDGRSDDGSNSDDMANMEEISVHDEPPREPLPTAPFTISNQPPLSQAGPDIVPAQADPYTPLSGPPVSQLSSSPSDVDPFTDPNEMPPSPPSEPAVMAASFPSASSVGGSEGIFPAREATQFGRAIVWTAWGLLQAQFSQFGSCNSDACMPFDAFILLVVRG
jgi:serine/threonine-protein phosphatase 6 regulatory subunit 3